MSEEETGQGGNGEDEESVVDPRRIDERIDRLEAIVRALESGDVDPPDRATRIAEGRALVAELERAFETVEAGEE